MLYFQIYVMNDDKKRELVLQIDYNKLLAYVAAGVISFFTLFQILFQLDAIKLYLYPIFVYILSTSVFAGAILFTVAGHHNFSEIKKLERKLKLHKLEEIKHSRIFSNEDHISKFLYLIISCFVGISTMLWYLIIVNV